MGQKVRAAVVERPGKMGIWEFDMPEIGREDGLLKIEMAGVCGTDPKRYAGKIAWTAEFPIIMGHEILGHIARVGDLASQRWGVKEGDRVIVEAMARCGYCGKCITGDYRFCEKKLGYGGSISAGTPPYLWGAYAEYMYLAPGSLVYRISEKVPAPAAVLVNAVVADALYWGRLLGNFSIGDTIVIQGPGQQGLCQVIVAKESGCSPIIITGTSRCAERFKLAREFGADYVIDVDREDVIARVRALTEGRMADVVVDVAGNPQSIPASLELVKVQGTLVLPTVVGEENKTSIATDRIVRRDIKIVGVYTSDARVMGRAIKLVESGKYPIEKMVSHVFPLDEAEKAVQTAGGYFRDIHPTKVVIKP
ncbi:MAG: alcohol dehydrogenase catalytic domain-containing protein [Chloroflexota bacterium]